MIVEVLEDTLNGGYGGLYGEVVTEDSYRMKLLKFVPDAILDIGANVGIFTRFARELFPNAIIIALEPDPENFSHLTIFTEHDENTFFMRAALGSGDVYKCAGAVNGAHETYLTDGPGNPTDRMIVDPRMQRTEIGGVMLDQLMSNQLWAYLFDDEDSKTVLKLDCEGNETVIFNDPKSMEAFKKIDYICGEFHNQALSGDLSQGVRDVTMRAMEELKQTHDVEMNHIYFFATKK